jgi:hypothetical protein
MELLDWCVPVVSWSNSVWLSGVRIHALVASKAKANALSICGAVAGMTQIGGCGGVKIRTQQSRCQQVGDFLLRVPGTVSGWGDGERLCGF